MTNEDQESTPITRRELMLFALFGIVPLSLLYLFGSFGLSDKEGHAFEEDRRALLADCREVRREMDACRARVDKFIMECVASGGPRPEPVTDAYRVALRTCVNEGHATWQPAPPVEEKDSRRR